MDKFRASVGRICGQVSNKVLATAALAIAAIAGVVVASDASAQYTPTTPTPESLFDFAAMGTSFLTIAGAAMAVVVGIGLTIAIGLGIYRRFRGQAS